jgi:hypothetical protein
MANTPVVATPDSDLPVTVPCNTLNAAPLPTLNSTPSADEVEIINASTEDIPDSEFSD